MMKNQLAGLMKQAQQMQAKLQQAQEEIVKSSVVGEAGGGLVTVTMRGSGQISDLTMDEVIAAVINAYQEGK